MSVLCPGDKTRVSLGRQRVKPNLGSVGKLDQVSRVSVRESGITLFWVMGFYRQGVKVS